METKIEYSKDMHPLRKEIEPAPLETEHVRNEAKHRATCLKNKLKRKSKKR